jgi:hypothetical protein
MTASWKMLSLSTIKDAIPPPGDYQGAVIGVKLIDKPSELWLQITFGLRDHAEEIRQLYCIAAAPGSPHCHRVADGLRAVNRLLLASKRTLDNPDPAALPPLLTGIRLTLTIAHKTADGVPELTLRNITPANQEA